MRALRHQGEDDQENEDDEEVLSEGSSRTSSVEALFATIMQKERPVEDGATLQPTPFKVCLFFPSFLCTSVYEGPILLQYYDCTF